MQHKGVRDDWQIQNAATPEDGQYRDCRRKDTHNRHPEMCDGYTRGSGAQAGRDGRTGPRARTDA